MKIFKGDYILGVWNAVKEKGRSKGYATIIAKRNFEGVWELELGVKNKNKLSRHNLFFKDRATDKTIISRASLIWETGAKFYPDKKQYIEVKGDIAKAALILATVDWIEIKQVNGDFEIIGV